MNLSGDCDLLYIFWHLARRTQSLRQLSREASIPVGHYPDNQALTLRA